MLSISAQGGQATPIDGQATPVESESSIEVPLANLILMRAWLTAEEKTMNSSSFVSPAAPVASSSGIGQKTDYFSKIKPVANDGSNFLIFRKHW